MRSMTGITTWLSRSTNARMEKSHFGFKKIGEDPGSPFSLRRRRVDFIEIPRYSPPLVRVLGCFSILFRVTKDLKEGGRPRRCVFGQRRALDEFHHEGRRRM